MEKKIFGYMPNGEAVECYTLKNAFLTVKILTLGGIINELWFGGDDLVCGFSSVGDYLLDDSYQGALIGRVGNRIGGSEFLLNGKKYQLSKNEGENHLHGGTVGFNRKLWNVEAYTDTSLALSLLSPDGDEGYPGNLKVKVIYEIKGGKLFINYYATCDADTPISLTNHAYLNICGYNAGSILDQEIKINSSFTTEVDGELIPTGKHIPVENSIYDLREFTKIGKHIDDNFGGYDNNFILDSNDNKISEAACIKADHRILRVYTNQPSLQLYIGTALTGAPDFKGGYKKTPLTTYCLETQNEPDCIKRGEGILHKGEIYDKTTIFEFSEI